MFSGFGLARDPFSPEDEGTLYWESQARRALTREAERLLGEGKSLFVSGPPGSGRRSFLFQLASRVSEHGRPLALIQGSPDGVGASLMGQLHRRLTGTPPPPDDMETVEGVYSALLRGFWLAPPVLFAVEPWAWSAKDAAELEILLGLSFMNRPLLSVAACGEGAPPAPGMEILGLPPFQEAELVKIVRHRLSLSGKPDALPGESIELAARGALGAGDALGRASDLLGARMFLEPGGNREEDFPTSPSGKGVFSSEDLGEVGRLLAAISSGKNP